MRETLAQLIVRSDLEGGSAAFSNAMDALLAQLLVSPASSLVLKLKSEIPRPSAVTRRRGGGTGVPKLALEAPR